ncbi:MAG: HAMP domain-containing sensor histidine kinase [Candidatus Paceibacterota bacterium]|jgi:signal transduction histidine kinase
MKKHSIILLKGAIIGGLMGSAMYLLLFLRDSMSLGDSLFFAEYGVPFFLFFEMTIPLFITLGIFLSYVIFYKNLSDSAETIVLKNKDDNKAKDDLISMTLHHIRTPLTGMMWSTKELSFETPADHPQKNRIDKLCEETVRILNTVEKLIQTSRENNGRSSYCFENYSMEKLERLIAESVSKMRPVAYAKDISVEMETSPLSNRSVKIDNDKIITVVQTLFENAIHYTKSGGGIKMKMEEKGDDFLFYITDTGIGIPENEQANIFSQFYRSTNAKRVRSEGLGIGLFLAKSFMVAHNGNITFSSTPHGTTFIMKLPVFKLPEQTAEKTIPANNPQTTQPAGR